MKLFLYIIFALGLTTIHSCGSVATSNTEGEEPTEFRMLNDKGINGVITTRYAEQGCQFIFEYEDVDGSKKIVRPINLEEEFRKDMHVRVVYRVSRASNAGCDIAHPVIIDAIEEILPR